MKKIDQNHCKGYCFEEYIIERLDRRSCQYVWKLSQGDLIGESDIDVVFKNKGDIIPVSMQCKFRTIDGSTILWFDKGWQMEKYVEYAKQTRKHFFVVFGIGEYDPNCGKCLVERVFIVPLHNVPASPLDCIFIRDIEQFEVVDCKHKFKFLPRRKMFRTRSYKFDE